MQKNWILGKQLCQNTFLKKKGNRIQTRKNSTIVIKIEFKKSILGSILI